MTLFFRFCRRCDLTLVSFAMCAQAHAIFGWDLPPPPRKPTPTPQTNPAATKAAENTTTPAAKGTAKTTAISVGCENGEKKSR